MSAYLGYPEDGLNLQELALRLRWSAVAERAAIYPHEIAQQDIDGLTVLHWSCCNNPPLRLLRALAEESRYFQIACFTRDSNGMTPLLCAIASHAAVAVVAFLVRAFPESASIPDEEGWSALHYVASMGKGYVERVESLSALLLRVQPKLASIRDHCCRTALHFLCDQYSPELRSLYHQYDGNGMSEEMQKLWSVVEMFVKEMTKCSPLPNSASAVHTPIVRRLIHIPNCPEEIAMLSVRMEAEGLDAPDENGNTALHLALEAKAESLAEYMIREGNIATISSARNRYNETPLCVARKRFNGWRKVHYDLLEAFPEAVPSSGLNSKLFPALLERIDSCHDATFRILKESPYLYSFSGQR